MIHIRDLNKISQSGFTLLEVMVAVAIIAVAFTGVLKLHSQSLSMNTASNFYSKGPLLAQKVISEWETQMKTSDYSPNLEDSLEEFPGFSFKINRDSVDSENLYSGQAEDSAGKLYKVVCTVLYNSGEYKYTTETLKYICK